MKPLFFEGDDIPEHIDPYYARVMTTKHIDAIHDVEAYRRFVESYEANRAADRQEEK